MFKNIPEKHQRIILIIFSSCVFLYIAHGVYKLNQADTFYEDPATSYVAEYSAHANAVDFVKRYLKAPKTASFEGFEPSSVIKIQGEDLKYIVDVVVTAQNAFGAMLTKHFIVTVERVGDQWLLIDIGESN